MRIKRSTRFSFFATHPIRFTLFATLVALYHATFLNMAFYMHIFEKITLTSVQDVFFLLTMPMVIFCVVFAFLNLLIVPKLAKIAAIVFFLIGSVLSYFMLTFNIVINHDMLVNALSTDKHETLSLMTPTLFLFIFFLGIVPSLLVMLIHIKPSPNKTQFLSHRLCMVLGALMVILLIGSIFFKNYAAFFRNNTIMTRYLLPSNYMGALLKHYTYLKNRDMPFTFIGQDAHIKASAAEKTKKTLVIMVVGETARAKNFSLNGYEKETNPTLKTHSNLINFPTASSCGTFTAHSVPCMFSNMPREQYNAIKAEHQSNVLDILKQVGVNMIWYENNSTCKGVCDRIPHKDMSKPFENVPELCGNGLCYDDVLFSELDEAIEGFGGQNGLITLHTIGSHGPSYYQRYPPKFDVFKPSCDTNEINKCNENALVNTYDNTILYTDHILSKTIETLKKYRDKYNVVMIYMSDHGESLGENGVYLHSMPYAFAPQEQTHIPFILWGSSAFFKDNHIDKACLQKRANQHAFSHDNLFHSLLGIFQVDTEEYQPNLDIFSACKVSS